MGKFHWTIKLRGIQEVLSNPELLQNGYLTAFEALSKVETYDGKKLLAHRSGIESMSKAERMRAYQWTLDSDLIHPLHFAVMVGTGFGGGDVSAEVWDILKAGDIPDEHMMRSLSDRAASSITQAILANGGAEADTAACASSGKAMLNAIRKITLGEVEAALVVGTEGVLNKPIASAMFDAMGALDRGKDPLQVSRCLHEERGGFAMAEGAVGFVISDYDWAIQNNIPILYKITGFGETSGADHNTDPNTLAQAQAMMMAKRRALMHGQIDGCILNSGHYTGTVKGELSELTATLMALGDLQDRLIIYASKRFTGHMLGAAGNLSQFVAGRALQEKVVPGMVFVGEVMKEAEGLRIPRETYPEPELRHAVVNQFGFGDANVTTWLTTA